MKLKIIPAPKKQRRNSVETPHSRPSFYVSSREMPEIADWEVGGKYRMVIEVEQKSKSEDNERMNGSFEIVAYMPLREKTIHEMSDREFGTYQGKKMSGK